MISHPNSTPPTQKSASKNVPVQRAAHSPTTLPQPHTDSQVSSPPHTQICTRVPCARAPHGGSVCAGAAQSSVAVAEIPQLRGRIAIWKRCEERIGGRGVVLEGGGTGAPGYELHGII